MSAAREFAGLKSKFLQYRNPASNGGNSFMHDPVHAKKRKELLNTKRE